MAVTPRKIEIGFIDPAITQAALILLLRTTGVVLILLSVVGSFYGLQGQAAAAPSAIIGDMVAAPFWLVLAIATQLALSIAQWGSRAMARDDRRWWLLFAASLAVSSILNWIGYSPHLLAWGWPLVPVAIAVIIGDALAEILVVR
jgi:hypothetical protein